MAILSQTWILTKKTLLIVAWRQWFFTSVRAFWAPIIFMFFITYAKNFFIPPSQFGIGNATPIRSFPNALAAATGGRDKVVFVNNGYTGGDIDNVIGQLSDQVRDAGLQAITVEQEVELLTTCAGSLRGASTCFGAVTFHSSPNEGGGPAWNYTLRADGVLGSQIYVDQEDNDVQIYILPFQRAIDETIASLNSSAGAVPAIDEFPYTERTQEERDERIRVLYMGALINIMGAALYIGVCGVTYQLTGQMAEERERGISQLVEAMSPAKKAWHTQFARLLANHIAFDIIYFPGWVIMGLIVWALAFKSSNAGILVIFHILAGLSLTSFSIFGAAFFRKAQLSGITIVIIPILLAIIAQVAGPFSTSAVYVLSLIFPSINYVFFIVWVARFERELTGANLGQSAPVYEDHVWTTPGIVFWVFLIIQALVYPFLGALVERWLYGTVSADRKTTTDSPDHNIILRNFSKHWTPSWFRRNVLAKIGIKPPETVIAVDDFSIKARKGQIMVLLGANGSGKSTTLDAIAGLNTITSGSIEIDGTGGLGLCPQKNVMWDELNVYEHVRIFNQLKSTGKFDSKDTIEDLIRACDLGHKIKARSSTLSGGQKRKLQLAMMFTGGSRVCCVDEVSSGLDPLSRRKIWEILLAERGDRTFLLTTHFLDEADVLADYIAILSRGVLKTKGTSVQLKHEVGAGYHVTYPRDAPVTPPVDATKKPAPSADMIQYWFPDALPATHFVGVLRSKGVKNYDIVGPTLEDVFLAMAEEVKEHNLMDANEQQAVLANKDADHPSSQVSDIDKGLEMGKGRGTSMGKQTLILMQKRWTILRRNFWPYVFALLLPIIAAGLVTLFLKNYVAVGCDPGENANDPEVFTLASTDEIPLIPIGPTSLVGDAISTIVQRSGINNDSFYIVDTLDEFNDFVQTRFRNITPGGFFIRENEPTIMAYLGSGGVVGGLITLNTLDNVLSNVPISTQYQQFAVPFSPSMGDTLQLTLYFGLAMCVFPALFALYPTQERLRKVRALHYSNGIRAVPLWLAYTAFDFIFVLIIAGVTTAIFVGASDAFYGPGYLFVVFSLYGLTAILFSYLISIVVTSQLAAFAFAAGGMVSLYLIYFIGYMAILTYAPAYKIDDWIDIFHWTVSLIAPSGSLLRTQLLSLNSFSVLCDGNQIPSYPGKLQVYGGPILYLTVQAILLFIALVWWDSGYRPPFLNRANSRQKHTEENIDTIPPAVLAETTRTEQSKDSLRVLHLQKTFGSNHAVNDISFGIPQGQVFGLLGPNGAGKSSTISLIRGDIHPTTHINGGGDVLIEDISIISKRAAARGHLGVCPQFDAMDSMTVTEHLYFYARARGVPDPESSVNAILQATGLARFQTRLASKLSGGNKRKLSLGIALMGNPSVLLLDEPSSGMDAAAKRVMWRTLLGVAAPGRALLITTHSMEEADKLATRVGIMKRKMLALGTVGQLGEQYGDAWVVQLVLKSAPETTEEEMEACKEWVRRKIPGVQMDKWGSRGGGHGQLRFKVLKAAKQEAEEYRAPSSRDDSIEKTPADANVELVRTQSSDLGGIPGLIQLLESNRQELGLEYYSVSPTTLDEVFLKVVGEEEEETGKKEKHFGGFKKTLTSLWCCM